MGFLQEMPPFPRAGHPCVCLFHTQDMITHQMSVRKVEEGIALVNSSKESIKVVLLPEW